MKQIIGGILVLLYTTFVIIAQDSIPYCYQFTWIAPTADNKPDKYNCSAHRHTPCFNPVFETDQLPTPEELRNKENTSCPLTTGNVCMKYTFTYNNEIENVTSFCGKIVQDQVTAITTGCYVQLLNGYTVEVCACKTRRGTIPCNASVNITYSDFLLLITLLFTFVSTSYQVF